MKYPFNAFLISTLVMFNVITLTAQSDNTFWFAAPDVSNEHGYAPKNGAPIYLNISAHNQTNVIISRPADPGFAPIVFSLIKNEFLSILLTDYLAINDIETYPLPNPSSAQQKGFLIESFPGEISVTYELTNRYNSEIFSLKGSNALGKDFMVGTQNQFPNGDYNGTAHSGFVIVATQDNTTININQNDAWLYFPNPMVHTLILNKGETYAFRAEDTDPSNHINGARVTADKDIAITLFDDSIRKKSTDDATCSLYTSYDIVGDQTVPVENVGSSYLVLKGEVTNATSCDGGERVFIMATEGGTDVFSDEVLASTLDNAGDVASIEINNYVNYISTSKPVYAFHVSGFGGELAGAVLMPIEECRGSHSYTFKRSVIPIEELRLNIIISNDTVRTSPNWNQAINHFKVEVRGTIYNIPPVFFNYHMDSAYVVLRDLPEVHDFFNSLIRSGDVFTLENDISRFFFGTLEGNATGGAKYCWHSGYGVIKPSASIGGSLAVTQEVFCNLDPVTLVASGGSGYAWECVNLPEANDFFSDTTVAAPVFTPTAEGLYLLAVTITNDCFTDTTINLSLLVTEVAQADFSIQDNIGCSPFSTTITNNTDPAKAPTMFWRFENPLQEINQDTLSMSFTREFPGNTSDTIQSYPVALHVYGEFYTCPSVKRDTVKVLPGVVSSFDTYIAEQSCSDITVGTTNLSEGAIANYFWQAGHDETSTEAEPVFTYTYPVNPDTLVYMSLIAIAGNGCSDTIVKAVEINTPPLETKISIPAISVCSPMSQVLSGAENTAADSLAWVITYPGQKDSLWTEVAFNYPLIHNNSSSTNDTIAIRLYLAGGTDCAAPLDTFVVVHPEVTADFSMQKSGNCTPVEVQFENLSTGTSQLWDLGNGTSSTLTSPEVTYNYFGNSDTLYHAGLITFNAYGCSDTAKTEVYLHAFSTAVISMEKHSLCSPANMVLSGIENELTNLAWVVEYPYQKDSIIATGDHLYNFEHINETGGIDSIPITLYPIDEGVCIEPLDTFITVYPAARAEFVMNKSGSCSPVDVQFENLSYGATEQWNFGDGTTSQEASPVKRFTSNGSDTTYLVHLFVSTTNGCRDTTSAELKVQSILPAKIFLEDIMVCSPADIDLSGQENIGADSLLWFVFYPDLMDSVAAPFNEPYHLQHTNPGNEADTIQVILHHFGVDICYNPLDTFVVINPEVQANFEIHTSQEEYPKEISTTNNSVNALEYLWDFGDGTSSMDEEVTHTYHSSADTIFQLKLIALNGTCKDSMSLPVSLSVPLHISSPEISAGMLDVYYNYYRQVCTIENYGQITTIEEFTVLSLNGQTILRKNLGEILETGSRLNIEIPGLSKNKMYLLLINSSDGSYIVKIVI